MYRPNKWRGGGHELEPPACRWDLACLSMLPMLSSCRIQTTVKSCRTQLSYEKEEVPTILKGQYQSIKYGFVCHGSFFQYRSPPRALIGWETRTTELPTLRHCCQQYKHRLLYDLGLLHVPDAIWSWCLPRNGCTAEVLWCHNACWRARFQSGYSGAAFRPCQLWIYVCWWTRTAPFCFPNILGIRCSSHGYCHLRLLSVVGLYHAVAV